MLLEITTEWDNKYDTHPNAKPDGHLRHVVDVLAIRLTNGYLRGSEFDGVFELADVPKPLGLWLWFQHVYR